MNKKRRYNPAWSVLLLGLLVMASCADFEEFESSNRMPAPGITLVQERISDSTIVVEVTSTMEGYAAVALYADTGNITPDPEQLLTGNVASLEHTYTEIPSEEGRLFTLTASVVQDARYEVMAVVSNADGITSEVAMLEVVTTDQYGPNLTGITPSTTPEPLYADGTPIVLTFDEPVMAGTGSDFFFTTYFGGDNEVVPAENVEAAGNEVTITIPFTPAHGDYLFLSWEEGALTDASGNDVAAMNSGVVEGYLEGLYWGVALVEMAPSGVAPDTAAAQPAGFDIELTFDQAVALPESFEVGQVRLTYSDGDRLESSWDVAVEDITASGNVLTIAQTDYTPASGFTVTLTMDAGALEVGLGNPSAEVSAAWTIE